MNNQQLQKALNRLTKVHPPLEVDGILGNKSMAAIDSLLVNSSAVDWWDWADPRRVVAAKQIVFEDAKIPTGKIDGLEGEQTRYAESVWDAQQLGSNAPAIWREAEKPVGKEVPNPWPKQKEAEKFFGKPGSGMVLMEMPFPLRLAWDPKTLVMRVSVHEKCRAAFAEVWKQTLLQYGYEELRRLRLDMFGGCLNVRKMRGGSEWSMHAFGAAWDIDPDRNQLKWGKDKASLDGPEYKKFWAIVEKQGGLSLGKWKNYDWMHFQWTSDGR